MYVTLRPYRPVAAHGEQTLSGAFAPTKETGADGLLVQALGANIRFRIDGTDPDANTGFQLLDGAAPLMIPIGDNTTPKFIQESGSPVLQYQWVKQI